MSREKIIALVPVRKGSQRIKNKNFKPFANKKNLLTIKLEVLKQVELIDDIVVSTDSEEAIQIAKSLDVSVHNREKFYASSECNNSQFFENLAQNIQGDYLIYSPCTAPLIKPETYIDFINRFSVAKKDHDSMNTINYVKEHMWLKNKPLNYNPSEAPNTQDLPDIIKLTYGINILSRNNMIKYKNVVGKNPMFYDLDPIESVDVDTPVDFEFAQFLFNKYKYN